MKQLEIQCQECLGTSIIRVQNKPLAPPYGVQIEWYKIGTVISGRQRLDGELGFQCKCGNNSMMTAQEKQEIKNWQAPKPEELSNIIAKLRKPSKVETNKGVLVDKFLIR